MTLYALDDLGDAFAATRDLLTPVSVRQWLRLAVIVLFVGGFLGNSSSFSFPANGTDGVEPPPAVDIEPWAIAAIVVTVLLVALVIGLLYLVASGIMEFVFVESLRRREVRIRRHARRRWRQGVRLALFRLGLVVVFLVLAGIVVGLGIVPFLDGEPGPEAVLVLVVLVPIVLVVAFVLALIDGFTRAFVVPVMVVDDCNVLAGWRRLWPTITANVRQYLAWIVVAVVLSILFGVVLGVLTAIIAVVALVPFAIPFVAGIATLEAATPVGIAILVVTGLAFALVVLAGVAVVRVPFATYTRYFTLLVLGDVAPDLDPVSEVRASIREEPAPTDE